MAEPHYAQIIKGDKLQAFEVYPEVGWNPETMSVDPNAVVSEDQARVERDGNNVEIWMTVVRSHFKPERFEIKKGDMSSGTSPISSKPAMPPTVLPFRVITST